MLRVFLERNSCHVLEAQNEKWAFSLYSAYSSKIQCVIADGNGRVLARNIYAYCLKNERALLPVMICSESKSKSIRRVEPKEYIKTFLPKPNSKEALLSMIKEAI